MELSSGTISTSVITEVHHPSLGQPADSQRSARGSGWQRSINSQVYRLTRLLILIHGPPPPPEATAGCPGAQRGGRLCRAGRASVGTRPSSQSPRHPWGPRWSLKAAVMNPSKATSEDPRARKGLAHEASRAWCAFQLGLGETRPGLPACWGPTPAAPAHFWVGLTLHGADGRFQHPVLGPWGPSRGLCAVGTPGEEAPAALQKEGPCSPCVASTAGSVFPPLRRRMLPVFHPDRPGAASMSRRTAEEHTDPGTGQAMWAGQLPDEGRAGVLCVCDTHLPVHASLPGPKSDAALGPATASPTGARCFPPTARPPGRRGGHGMEPVCPGTTENAGAGQLPRPPRVSATPSPKCWGP